MQNIEGPKHVGIIMDGNGRWAKSRGWRRLQGHAQGAEKVVTIVDAALELKLQTLSLFCFSTENWKRSDEEVNFLMQLLYRFVDSQMKSYIRRNIRVRILGELEKAPTQLQEKLRSCMELTQTNTGLNLNFMMSYGGRYDIIQATRKIAQKIASGELQATEINENTISNTLCTSGLSDPDLIIRTSGEFRISNFMLWQSAYAEFYITPKFWPDFTPEDLRKACEHYANRERRFGCVTEPDPSL